MKRISSVTLILAVGLMVAACSSSGANSGAAQAAKPYTGMPATGAGSQSGGNGATAMPASEGSGEQALAKSGAQVPATQIAAAASQPSKSGGAGAAAGSAISGAPVPVATSGSAAAKSSVPAKSGHTETATFAGGCFWCMETAFEGLPGVISATSGYTGGTQKSPTYEQVGAGGTGHAESVQVLYDPAKISYAQLVDLYWHNIDPLQMDGQFCDHGTQYRSAIFYKDEAQRKVAEDSKRKLEAEDRFKGKIVTQIVQATTFYPAEDYHQDFYKKDPERYHSYRMGCGRDARLKDIWGQPGRSEE